MTPGYFRHVSARKEIERRGASNVLARIKELEGLLDRLLEHGGTRGRYHAIRWAEAVHEAERALAKQGGH